MFIFSIGFLLWSNFFVLSRCAVAGHVTFVLSRENESQLATCSGVGMYPTAVSASVDWSFDLFFNLLTSLGMVAIAPSGLSGCCVAGMWCNGTVCFTQSFSSSFQNFGVLPSLIDTDFQPVYSCDGGSFCKDGLNASGASCNVTVPPSSVSVTSATVLATPSASVSMVGDVVGSTVLIKGSNFGFDESVVGVSLSQTGGEATSPLCSYLELCTNVCEICSSSEDCSLGAACLHVGASAIGHCFPYCAGSQDDSCPCGIPCVSVVVSSALDSGAVVGVLQNFCAPDSDFTCLSNELYASGQDVAQCSVLGGVPVLADLQSASIIVGPEGSSEGDTFALSSNSALVAASVELVEPHGQLRGGLAAVGGEGRRLSVACFTDSDCNDGDRCTINSCVDSVCVATIVDYGCQSSMPLIQQKSAPFIYINVAMTNSSQRQSAFTTFMKTNGQLAVDSADDSVYHVPEGNVGSSIALSPSQQLQYFGNNVTAMGITPLGVITLTPVPFCDSTLRELLCVKYGSNSNSISTWKHNWAYEEDSQIWFYSQEESATAPLIDNSSAASVHVLYLNVYFDENKAAGESNTFSVSMYADGSVRLSYINVQYDDMEFMASNSNNLVASHPEIFSLFGARAGSSNSTSFRYLKYHEEFVPFPLTSLFPDDNAAGALAAGGLDVVYCYLPYALGCVANSCVSPTAGAGAQMVLQLQSNSGSSEDMHSRNEAAAKVNSCNALGTDLELQYHCVWPTGEATAASLSSGTLNNSAVSAVSLSCDVPALNVSDGTLISVTVIAGLSSPSASASVVTDMSDGVHSLFTVTSGGVDGSETSSSEIMVRYYHSGNLAAGCGCNAMQSDGDNAIYQCSACNVCTATDSSVLDCAGSCFGSSYFDSCGDCSGGLSGVVPDMYCDFDSGTGKEAQEYNLVSFILFVFFCSAIIMCCCVLKIFSRNAAMSRHGNLRRQMQINEMLHLEITRGGLLDDDGFAGVPIGRRNRAQPEAPGLTKAEIKLLTSFKYEQQPAGAKVGAEGDSTAAPSVASASLATSGVDTGEIELSVLSPEAKTDAEHTGEGASPAPGEDSECCSICLESFKPGDSCRKLPDPCGHTFHESCIDLWLEMKTNCPLCKRSIKDLLPGRAVPAESPDRGSGRGRSGSASAARMMGVGTDGSGGYRQIHISRHTSRGGRDAVFRVTSLSPQNRAFIDDHDEYQDLPTIPVSTRRPMGSSPYRVGSSSASRRLRERQDDLEAEFELQMALATSMSLAESREGGESSSSNQDMSARSDTQLLYSSVPPNQDGSS